MLRDSLKGVGDGLAIAETRHGPPANHTEPAHVTSSMILNINPKAVHRIHNNINTNYDNSQEWLVFMIYGKPL